MLPKFFLGSAHVLLASNLIFYSLCCMFNMCRSVAMNISALSLRPFILHCEMIDQIINRPDLIKPNHISCLNKMASVQLSKTSHSPLKHQLTQSCLRNKAFPGFCHQDMMFT